MDDKRILTSVPLGHAAVGVARARNMTTPAYVVVGNSYAASSWPARPDSGYSSPPRRPRRLLRRSVSGGRGRSREQELREPHETNEGEV